MIRVDLSQTAPFVPASTLSALYPRVKAAHGTLEGATGAGAEFTGWLRLPTSYDRAELSRIKSAAGKIRQDSEVLFVVGIGGSYLGARAALEFILTSHYNLLRKNAPEIHFTGNSLSGDDLAALLAILGDRDFSVNVISKSGTTTEPAVAFRILRAKLSEKYGDAAKERIFATTDRARGALKALAESEGWETFVVPDDIGGRYSVLTAVGLLPMAAAGIDVDEVLRGAAEAQVRYAEKSPENPVWQYAAARNALYEAGKSVELLTCYEPSFQMTAEWWKQLFGESEGKKHKGLFPACALFTTDLHSLGQYVQDGARLFLETVVRFSRPRHAVTVPLDAEDGDGLNFLAGRALFDVNEAARRGTALAHMDGGVPLLTITADAMDAAGFGELVYFFELACGISGYTLGVNPFDQPGVEDYKRNMFALLGKPGHEKRRAALLKRLGEPS